MFWHLGCAVFFCHCALLRERKSGARSAHLITAAARSLPRPALLAYSATALRRRCRLKSAVLLLPLVALKRLTAIFNA